MKNRVLVIFSLFVGVTAFYFTLKCDKKVLNHHKELYQEYDGLIDVRKLKANQERLEFIKKEHYNGIGAKFKNPIDLYDSLILYKIQKHENVESRYTFFTFGFKETRDVGLVYLYDDDKMKIVGQWEESWN